MPIKKYDYAIVGTGAAGFQLALKMASDSFFAPKSILLIDKDLKKVNDRTWSFWEKGETNWDSIALKIWKKGKFVGKQQLDLTLNPYRYKTIRSADFYAYAKVELSKHPNVELHTGDVISIENGTIECEGKTYEAAHVFDSRVDPLFEEKKDSYSSLVQHFRGWFIETKEEVFDEGAFTMMDYRLKWKDSTSFTYVLPFSKTKALVEFTLFNQYLIKDQDYDQMMKEYIEQYLKISAYEIVEIEQGAIPMSDYPFHQHHDLRLTKIGTAGGWVRPSSGYSFKNSDRYTSKLIENLKKGRRPEKSIGRSRFRLYDSIFLKVLADRNDLGEDIFTTLYQKQPVQRIFRFLDEESTFWEDFQIIHALNHSSFRKAFLSKLKFW